MQASSIHNIQNNTMSMATLLWLSCIMTLVLLHNHLVSTFAKRDNYIIHMDLSAMPQAFSNQHTWYLSTLSDTTTTTDQATTTNSLKNSSSSSSKAKLIYTYTNAINGFSASLSLAELEALKTTPGYISSVPDFPVKLHTTHTPQFLGLNPHVGVWPAAEFGRDVIVGVVDTGIWPESESFRDSTGLPQVPSRWKGRCENGSDFSSSLCNNKLIGARSFHKGFLAKQAGSNNMADIPVISPRDIDGHGTHTSSTAAGSRVDGASYFGYAPGSATGIAPLARVAMYKVFWDEGQSQTSDVIAAIDTAISDGVDVLSMSLGFDAVPLYRDPIAIASFAAMEKGVFVSTSAGNDGPLLKTLHNGTPWVITVAGSSVDREFHGTLTLGNGVLITGLSLYSGNFSSNSIPIVFMGDCDSVKKLAKVRSRIVVCEDTNGTILPLQVINVEKGKVLGAVFISNSSEYIFYLNNKFASIIVDPINGDIIKAYTNKGSKASMSFRSTVLGTRPAPSVASHSSRGPASSCPFVLKPDITAPGTLILAAWPTTIPLKAGPYKLFNQFNLISGTSMACPHIAGMAALLKGARPDWSPAAIRSAIMTTSDISDNTGGLIKDLGEGYNAAASPLALGAGHANPNRALDPGLVYDAGVQDYVNLLCALNFTQKNITAITRSSNNDCSNSSLDLNYPSFIVFFDASGNDSSSRVTTQEFERVVTNVGEGPTTYVATVTPIEGYRISVIPRELVFKDKNQILRYKLKIRGPRKTRGKEVTFGYLTWTDAKHVVRSPIVVTTLKF